MSKRTKCLAAMASDKPIVVGYFGLVNFNTSYLDILPLRILSYSTQIWQNTFLYLTDTTGHNVMLKI